ncbi:MAG: hypothetical protein WC765_09620 [Phycisphaerae bacterium]|jgi:hypothetical protein
MLTDAIKNLKKQFKNYLPEIIDAYKASKLKEAIGLLDKAESLLYQDSDRDEIDRLVTRAVILCDIAGGFNERLNPIQTQIQRGNNKTPETGKEHQFTRS